MRLARRLGKPSVPVTDLGGRYYRRCIGRGKHPIGHDSPSRLCARSIPPRSSPRLAARQQSRTGRARLERSPSRAMRLPLPVPPGSAQTCAVELQSYQPRRDRVGRRARARDQRVDRDRVVPHRAQQRRVLGGRRIALVPRDADRRPRRAEAELVEHVLRGLDELRAFADQLVTALWRTANGSSRESRTLRGPARPPSAR